MVWLTDEWPLALFPRGTVVRDPHNHESTTRHKHLFQCPYFNVKTQKVRRLSEALSLLEEIR